MGLPSAALRSLCGAASSAFFAAHGFDSNPKAAARGFPPPTASRPLQDAARAVRSALLLSLGGGSMKC